MEWQTQIVLPRRSEGGARLRGKPDDDEQAAVRIHEDGRMTARLPWEIEDVEIGGEALLATTFRNALHLGVLETVERVVNWVWDHVPWERLPGRKPVSPLQARQAVTKALARRTDEAGAKTVGGTEKAAEKVLDQMTAVERATFAAQELSELSRQIREMEKRIVEDQKEKS